VKYEDPAKHFRFSGNRALCQIEAQIEFPSIGSSWKSDPLNASKCDVTILAASTTAREELRAVRDARSDARRQLRVLVKLKALVREIPVTKK
jgi:hypothetical protein